MFSYTFTENMLTKDTACSHIRAFELFLETVRSKADNSSSCEFIAYKCDGGYASFDNGQCFTQVQHVGDRSKIDLSYRDDVSVLGEDARGTGITYFNTKASSPFCGLYFISTVLKMHRVIYITRIMIKNIKIIMRMF